MKHFNLLLIIFLFAFAKASDDYPVALCKEEITVYVDEEGVFNLSPEDIDDGSYDEFSGIDFMELSEYEMWCDYIWEEVFVSLYVTNNDGNTSSCEARVTVLDTLPPIDAFCQDIEIEITPVGYASLEAWELDAGSSDNCGIEEIVASQTQFFCEHIGENEVEVFYYDASGNVSSCIAIVTVTDPTPAEAVCLYGGIVVYLNYGEATIGLQEINDNYEACRIASWDLSHTYFTCEDIGVTEVTLTVLDDEGNETSCVTEVSVEDAEGDLEAVCKDVEVQLIEGVAFIDLEDIDGGSVATCGFSYDISQTEFGTDDIGENTVTLTITDASDNQSDCEATVTVLGEDANEPVDCVVSDWSDWSDCTASCGGGIQVRTRTVLVPAANGGAACPELEEYRACNEQECCESDWFIGEYGECSAECGGGEQVRVVECRDCEGNVLPDGDCAGEKPTTSAACNESACCENDWFVGEYGDCSVDCGEGEQTRVVECRDCEGNVLADGECSGEKPATTTSCNGSACCEASWFVGEYGDCSVECGSGVKTRVVECRDCEGNLLEDGQCLGEKPQATTHCSMNICCRDDWYVGEFGACDAECGEGVQTRIVECRDCAGNPLPDERCLSAKPATTMICFEQECPDCEVPNKPGRIYGPKPRICLGSTSDYHINPVPGATSYFWAVSNGGSIISGQGTTNVTVQFPGGQITYVELKVRAINDCGNSDFKYYGGIWSINTNGCNNGNPFEPVRRAISSQFKLGDVPAKEREMDISVYPNPSRGIVHLQISHLDDNEQVQVRILDLQGREVAKPGIYVNGSRMQVDLHNLPAGIYLLEATSGKQRKIQKLVKE